MPPKVEYSLSDHGKSLIPVFEQLNEWGSQHKEFIQDKDND